MSNFPTSLPSFTNPGASDYLNSPAHSTQHSSVNNEVVALATKVGVNSSAVTTTHDYKLSGVTGSDKAVSKTGTETLTNKTLTSPTITTPTVNGTIQVLTTDTDGATVTFNLSTSSIHTVILGGNRTLALSNSAAGKVFVIRLTQDGTGTRTVTWFTTIKWANGTTPTLTTTINKTDVFGFICTSTNNYDGYIIGQNL